ncbi:hypothetical protein JST97_09530 [bacterium]|nr:hypothetical protein [bacterium]
MRFVPVLLLLLSAPLWADPETNVYSLIVEDLKGVEADVRTLDRLLEKKVGYTTRDLDTARAKYAELKSLYEGERKKIQQFRSSAHPEAKETVLKLVDSQDKWTCNTVFVIDMEVRGNDYFKGKSVNYDPDRGPAMSGNARAEAVAARQLYGNLKAVVAEKLK